MRHTQTHWSMVVTSVVAVLAFAIPVGAYEVTLSLYNQGFNIDNFYDNGNFAVEKGIINSDPTSLLVIVGDPANVEDVLEIPEVPDPFELALLGSDFHFEAFQPFRFQDRFDGLFSTTVDDPVLLLPDNGVVTNFHDDGILADDRIDLTAYAQEFPTMYYEVNFGDTIAMQTDTGISLYITRIWRNPDFTVTFDISDVPEPGTFVLLGFGLLGIIGALKRKAITGNLLLIGLFVALFSIAIAQESFAAQIGPDYCSYQSVAICGQFEMTYHEALGQPTTPATLKCYTWYDVPAPYSLRGESCLPDQKEEWVQKFENGYIRCYDGVCNGYSQAPGPEDPVEPIEDPKLQSIDEPVCVGVENWGATYSFRMRDFDYNFSYYTPTSFTTKFSPATVELQQPDWLATLIGQVNLITPGLYSKFASVVAWNNYLDSLTKDVQVNVTAGNPADPGKYGSTNATITLVNEGARIAFGLDGIGIDPDDLSPATIKRIYKVIKKFNDWREKMRGVKKIWKFFKTLPGPDPTTPTNWNPSGPEIDSIEMYAEHSKLCCSTDAKDAFSGHVKMELNLQTLKYYTPRWYLPYGFIARGTMTLGLNAEPEATFNTDCKETKACLSPNVNFDVGGGFNLAWLDPVVVNAEITLIGRASTDDSRICFDALENKLTAEEIKVCMSPVIHVEGELFTLIRKSHDSEIGSLKGCWEF